MTWVSGIATRWCPGAADRGSLLTNADRRGRDRVMTIRLLELAPLLAVATIALAAFGWAAALTQIAPW